MWLEDSDGTLYRYVGAGGTYNFSALPDTLNPTTDPIPSFTSGPDASNWVQIGGTQGVVYEYLGQAATWNLATTDFTDLNLWKPIPITNLVPQGLNVSDSNATAAGGILVLNDVRSATVAYVKNVNVTATGTIAINALDQATLSANNDSTVTNSGGSALAAGSELSVNGIIATNLVQSSASAYAQSSNLTSNSTLWVLGTGTGNVTVHSGDVVEAPPSSQSADFVTTPSSGDTNVKDLVAGQTVRLDANYGAVTDTVGGATTNVLVNPGDVVQNGTALYRYIGSSGQEFDLSGNVDDTDPADPSPDFSDSTNWAQIGGTAGALYQYVGPGSASSPASVDLNNTDYTNTSNWVLVQPGLYRYVGAASTTVNLAPNATLPNFASQTSGSPNWVQIGPATISIYATNTSSITASNSANTVSGGKGGGVLLAFNTLGWQSENFLFNAVDALLGTPDIDEAFGSSPLADVSAYAVDSSLDATAGSVSVEALEQAMISATTSNATASIDSGLANEDNADAIGAVLATNMVNAQAEAYIDAGSSTQAGGGSLSIIAKDDAEITATNDQVVAAAAISSPQGLLLSYLGNVVNDYQYTSSSGTQSLNAGDLVYVGTSTLTPTFTASQGTETLNPGDTVLAGNGDVYRYDGLSSSSVNLSTTDFATSNQFDLNIYEYTVAPKYIASQGTESLNPNDTVLGADGKVYRYTGSPANPINLSTEDFDSSSLFSLVTVNLGTTDYTNTSLWTPLTYSSLANSIPTINLTASNATAVGAMFVLNDVRSTVKATVNNTPLSAAGNLTIDAENNATIVANNSSTVTASGGSPFAPEGQANGYNVTIASNYVLASTIASATGSSLTTSNGGNIDITALSNASIDAEMDATTQANSSTIGVVLAFNTIGINEPVGGFLEGTVDALFGTDLAGENPDLVEAYAADTTIDASGGVAVTANDTADITADVSNSSLGMPGFLNGQQSSIASTGGVSVGATIALNHVATDVEAYVDQTTSGHTVTSGTGDIDIESRDGASVESTVVTPVVKIGITFGSGASSAIGVSIARNIVDSNVSAYDGGRVIGGTSSNPVYDIGLALTANAGNVNITATDTASINATSAATAIALSVSPSGAGGFAGGGAVAINTILGSVIANAQNVAIAAAAGGANTGNVTVSATDNRQITANVAALSAQASLGDAVAIGASVALNLIGWNGTVADETEDSHNPIVVMANVNGGSINAGGAVSVTATSTSKINASTAAVAVAIGVSLDGGDSSGNEEGEEGGEDGEGEPGRSPRAKAAARPPPRKKAKAAMRSRARRRRTKAKPTARLSMKVPTMPAAPRPMRARKAAPPPARPATPRPKRPARKKAAPRAPCQASVRAAACLSAWAASSTARKPVKPRRRRSPRRQARV